MVARPPPEFPPLQRDGLCRLAHALEDVVHVGNLADGELIGDAEEVQARAAHEHLGALLLELFHRLDDLLLSRCDQLHASVHEQKRRRRVARFGKRVESHLHKVVAKFKIAIAHEILADEHGVPATARGRARASSLGDSGRSLGLGTVALTEGDEPAALDLVNRRGHVLLLTKTREVLHGRLVVNLDSELHRARVELLFRHDERHRALLAETVEDFHGGSFLAEARACEHGELRLFHVKQASKQAKMQNVARRQNRAAKNRSVKDEYNAETRGVPI